ncbi:MULTISPECIES: flagellar hook capping FlgD N-terminal domain-containing protein [Cohnella]|uniref:flagellar hook capping FlgD N-terminal domain-containing protein n=1 Tax=Cohnella TaxID=329857 RepID=UPI00036B6A3A|nr:MULTISPECIES: flagellar hook capping FlgD N-terminal domain-containing protein [Cohnella]REK67249.1 MAG: flagellar hook assembly protein FlgD [Cohnella sp.]
MASSSVSTTNVWPYYSSQNVQKAAARSPSSELGKDDFLKILITQLSNQDPLQPMDNTQFISQMAQFSSLEQMMNVSKQMEALRYSPSLSSGVIGMQVEWYATNSDGSTSLKSGIVDSIVMRDGVPYAKIGSDEVKVEELTSIAYPGKSDGGNGADEPEVTGA